MTTNSSELKDAEIRIALLENGFDRIIKHHGEFKEDLKDIKDNIGQIKIALAKLPCEKHIEKMQSIGGQINWMWFLVSTIIVSLIGVGIHAYAAR